MSSKINPKFAELIENRIKNSYHSIFIMIMYNCGFGGTRIDVEIIECGT